MTSIGTPHSTSATKILLLGAGELGKEITIEAQRLGVEVIAIDSYSNAPAMQVAHKNYVVSMLDAKSLRAIIEIEKPSFIVPEVEAISTHTLIELEKEGFSVIPNANAVSLTMDREAIRRLAAEQLHLLTSPYYVASTYDEYLKAINIIGLPCVVKPNMSSSGKGQSIIRHQNDIEKAWQAAQTLGRAETTSVMIEAFIDFDYEVTLLTVRHKGGTLFCPPIGHVQVNGDYQESWQPHTMPPTILKKAEAMANIITDSLGGYGLFGVEFFVKDEQVYFNEISPRPHDTGLVTLISQDLSEFALHVRAILGLPIPAIRQVGYAASRALLAHGHGNSIRYHNIDKALSLQDTQIRLFGKPSVQGKRRVGVLLSLADSIYAAREKLTISHDFIRIEVC